ncbi:peptidase domain-containing ABC transporter [Arenibacter sp. GZD96]|uniref:peptidase domain-containing ABC transporter n=1 Tax=Aurantibrevibacter litoralis TaxID=3106030 RepID=UPI002AFE9391|nr:peptidase domain-containing ABC transporter [Arenibacter sp. GZD-96]MEA1787165.1 peptidase domain-containing ABC transporter [Arenibacter sp. GZD-96]
MNLKHLKKTVSLQLDASDCGVACLLSVIRFYGGDASLDGLRRQSGTHKQGTTLLGLLQAAEEHGFDAAGKEGTLEHLKQLKDPIILHIITPEQHSHYVVCYGWQKDSFILGDPAGGLVFMGDKELDAQWVSKACLTLSPNRNFETVSVQRKNKKKWFWSILKPDIVLLRFSLILGIVVAVLAMALSVFSQKLIDDILPSRQMDKLIGGIGLLLLLLIVRIGLSALRDYFLIFQARAFNIRIIDSFYSSLLNLPKLFFDTRKIGELVARLNDTSRIQGVIQHIAGNAIIDGIVVIISVAFLTYYHWQSAIIALISLPIYFLVIYGYNKLIIAAQREVMKAYAVNESNYIATMQGISEIKNNNKEPFFKHLNQNIYGFFQNTIFALGRINIRLGLFSGLIGVIFIISILSYASYQVLKNNLTLGELMAILGIAGTLLPSVTNLALLAIPVNEAKIAFERMYEFTGLKTEQKGKLKPKHIKSISIRNASFRFAGRKRLFENVSIEVPSNSIVALLGESGSGKSTLGAVLQKHYDLEGGEILINGEISLAHIMLKSWRKKIGVVSQEITLFNGNVIDNLVLGLEENPKKVIDFCIKMGFDASFNAFPNGYGTLLGEEGVNISGGQKQILALARALYHKPDFLILDEATGALDRKTELFVLQLLKKLKPQLSIFFITHRIHILKDFADYIYVLEEGSITHSGSHEELLKSMNPYQDFWQTIS